MWKNLKQVLSFSIYKYDFLLHSEYFILNLFLDFLKNKGLGLDTDKNVVLKVIEKIDGNDVQIQECYETIKNTLEEYIRILREQPGYYHNKFFKNEKSIGLVRNHFSTKYNFIEAI